MNKVGEVYCTVECVYDWHSSDLWLCVFEVELTRMQRLLKSSALPPARPRPHHFSIEQLI